MATATPSVRLVRPSGRPAIAWREDQDADAVVAHTKGRLRVLGGPGSGKTSVLARAAAARMNAGASADEVLLLTFTRRGAAALRDAVVAETQVALRQVPVRSFESYAWAVLDRAWRRRDDWSAPRLITGPEQDAIVRDLLAGALDGEGATSWPDELRAALPTRGFAQEVRDALMRCAERGVSATQLRAWAEQHDRPVWESLGSFLTEYAGVTGMRLEDSYDPAELVRAVVDLWRQDPDELHRERQRLSYLYVDEAQELDPAKRELLELLAGGTAATVLAGDPDQSVFGFRGADRRSLLDFPADQEITLSTGYRATPALAAAMQTAAGLLGAAYPERTPLEPDSLRPVVVLASPSQPREAADVAGVLRERHLVDGVPWSQMCVIVRSVAASMPVIRRAFAAAGVPLDTGVDEPAVGQSTAVQSLLEIVRLSQETEADAARIEDVLRSPYFRLDALMMRRLRKKLRTVEFETGGGRTSARLLVEVVAGRLAVPPGPETSGLRELARILGVLRDIAAAGADGEELLATAWRETGAEGRWRSEALLGGVRGTDADQRLDSVIAAFDIASSLSSRLREASFDTIASEIEQQELPADRLSRGASATETVQVLSANNAKGREWEIVAVMGVQEGSWPNLVARNTLLHTEDLVDLAVGIDISVIDRRSLLMADERRLFYVALSRARRQVIVSSVDGVGERPSRFYVELCERLGYQPNEHRVERVAQRTLSMVDHVATLRACLLDEDAAEVDKQAATTALQLLAEAGVRGAAPSDWYALREVSTPDPVIGLDQLVLISPSAATTFVQCGLRWFLSRLGSMHRSINAELGTAVHAAFEKVGDPSGATQAELFNRMNDVLQERWRGLEFDSPWEERSWRSKARAMLERLAQWLENREMTWVGNEVGFDVVIGRARVRGKVDRLERDPVTGRLYTIDLKTGSVTVDGIEPKRNPQLGIYQLAAEHGGYELGAGSAGAALVGVKDGKSAKERAQPPVSEDAEPGWAEDLLTDLVAGMSAATFPARAGAGCRTCDFVPVCPAVRVAEDDE